MTPCTVRFTHHDRDYVLPGVLLRTVPYNPERPHLVSVRCYEDARWGRLSPNEYGDWQAWFSDEEVEVRG